MKTKLKAFNGDIKIKEKYLSRVKEHARLDNIIKGQYWENGKGCAVGCTIQSKDHLAYEIELGIPIILARLEDVIFERMSNAKAKTFPVKFLSAIKTGADLSLVWPRFVVWLLDDPIDGVGKYITDAKPAFNKLVDGYKLMIAGEKISREEWLSIREDSERERIGAASTAANYASTAAIYATASASVAADYATDYAAAVYDLNAENAYYVVNFTDRAVNATYPYNFITATKAQSYDKQATKLLELLKSAK